MFLFCVSFSIKALLALTILRYAEAAGEKSRQSKSSEIVLKRCWKLIKKFSAECQEYSKYVYVNEKSPVLSAAPSKSNTVSKCGIVETPLIVGGQRVNENEFPHMVNSGW